MEMWDIRDRDGGATGEARPAGAALAPGEYRLCGSLWIVDELGRLLIQKRAGTKKDGPGMWSITGGGARSGEGSRAACVREALEEIGLPLGEDEVRLFAQSAVWPLIYDDYIVERAEGSWEAILQAEEVAEIKWVSTAELRAMHEAGLFMYEKPELLKLIAYVDDRKS